MCWRCGVIRLSTEDRTILQGILTARISLVPSVKDLDPTTNYIPSSRCSLQSEIQNE